MVLENAKCFEADFREEMGLGNISKKYSLQGVLLL